ncbi:MAG: DUF3187 family protein [Steroidobacteraceae bacterium]
MPRHRALSLITALLLASPVGAGPSMPEGTAGLPLWLTAKDENPLLRGLYLPMPADARQDDAPRWQASLAAENTVDIESRDGERLHVDGEALLLRLSWDAPLRGRWRGRISVPLVRDSGGSLDSIIDRWHGWFGLPRGQRPFVAHDQFEYRYQGRQQVSLTRSHEGLGDVAAEAGWYWRQDARSSVALWAGLEAPTGSARAFTGNGAWDAALWLHADWRAGRWRLGAEVGLLRPFGDELFGGQARRLSAFGRTAVAWAVSSRWQLQAQLEAQSARLHDTGIRFLGPAAIGSLGLSHRLARRWVVQLGFSEDIAVNTAPDVTFLLSLRRDAVARSAH